MANPSPPTPISPRYLVSLRVIEDYKDHASHAGLQRLGDMINPVLVILWHFFTAIIATAAETRVEVFTYPNIHVMCFNHHEALSIMFLIM